MQNKVKQQDVFAIRQLLRCRREVHQRALWQEVERLTTAAAELGVQRVVLFGSLAWGKPGLTGDLDLLVVWDTSLDFVARAAELYRCLRPRVPADLLVYTSDEMERMERRPFIQRVLEEERVLYEA